MLSGITRIAAVVLPPLLLGGCGTIYVSNVSFTAVEVCSEELASRTKANTGCLPPTRAENAQGLYLARYRLQVSPAEAQVIAASSQKSYPPPASAEGAAKGNASDSGPAADVTNHVPSWIGRVFRARREANGSWTAPDDGNIEFIPLGGAPELKIATELQVQTDISGVVDTKIGAGAQGNPVAIVDAALGATGLVPGAAPVGLREALSDTVARVGYQRSSSDLGKGTYIYLSMKPEHLDSLTSALARCGWRIEQKPGSQSSRAGEPRLLGTQVAGVPCLGPIGPESPVDDSIRNLLERLQPIRASREDIQALGIVIGVAIIRTEGKSELCSSLDFSLLASGDKPTAISSKCQALRQVLDRYSTGVKSPASPDVASTTYKEGLSEAQKNSALMSLSFEYSRSTSKEMQLYPHTSVLAIHWIPFTPPAPK